MSHAFACSLSSGPMSAQIFAGFPFGCGRLMKRSNWFSVFLSCKSLMLMMRSMLWENLRFCAVVRNCCNAFFQTLSSIMSLLTLS